MSNHIKAVQCQVLAGSRKHPSWVIQLAHSLAHLSLMFLCPQMCIKPKSKLIWTLNKVKLLDNNFGIKWKNTVFSSIKQAGILKRVCEDPVMTHIVGISCRMNHRRNIVIGLKWSYNIRRMLWSRDQIQSKGPISGRNQAT